MFALFARMICGLAVLVSMIGDHDATRKTTPQPRPAVQPEARLLRAAGSDNLTAVAEWTPAPDYRRVYRVTAYCDRGTTASGIPSGVGQCAAPADIPFGSRIYIPELDRTFVVTDRTARRFRDNTVDLFIPARSECKVFGRQYIECQVTLPEQEPRYGSPRLLSAVAAIQRQS